VKSKSIGSLILLAILAPSCGSGGGGSSGPKNPPILVKWQTQQRVPTSSDLRGVIMATPMQCIIAGKDGTFFRTDDGGVNWTQQEMTQPQLGADITGLSANGTFAVAVGRDLATGNGRSYDGIVATWWTTDPAPATGAVYTDVNVSFPGIGNVPGVWWRIRVDGTVDYYYETLTGSYSTLNLSPPPPPTHIPPTHPIDWVEANGILFVGASGYGMVCGREPAYGGYPADPVAPSAYPADLGHPAQGAVIRTTDFGSSWIRQTIIPTTTKTFRRMILTKTDVGSFRSYLVGDDVNNYGILLATNPDIADQWVAVQGAGAPTTAPSFRALSFPANDQLGYVVGDGGTIYKITSTYTVGGTPPVRTYNYTWTQMTSNTTENLYAVSFVNNDVGYAVGDKGTVLKYDKNDLLVPPNTWKKLTRGTAAINFNAASFTDDGQKGIAVGDAGAIFRTLDGGLTWTPMLPAPTAQNLLGAAVPPGGAGTYAFACGANNTLLRNPDVWGIGTWSQATTITGAVGTETYRSILFPQTEDNGICVGTRSGVGVVLRTTAATGTTWAPPGTLPTLPSTGYYGMALAPSGATVYACGGSNGKISVTSDVAGGWDVWGDAGPAFPSALTLFSIASPEGGQFKTFVGANDPTTGKVWALSGGATPTWAATPAPWTGANPTSLGFQGEVNGVVVTSLGGLFTTIDGGANWTASPFHTKDKPRAIWVSRTSPGLAYAVANDGTILKTTTLGQ